MTLEDLRIAAKLAAENAATNVSETMERVKLTAIITNASNSKLIDTTAAINIAAETTVKLKTLEATCEQVITDMPIMNTRTRENRKWMPSAKYGFGNQIDQLTRILSGITYASAQHKPYLLSATGLNEDLVSQALEAFGSTAYYSTTYNVVVPEIPADLDRLLPLLAVIESELNITLDTSKLTPANIDAQFKLATIKAEAAQAAYELALAARSQAIAINE